jgi:hypothetical protein
MYLGEGRDYQSELLARSRTRGLGDVGVFPVLAVASIGQSIIGGLFGGGGDTTPHGTANVPTPSGNLLATLSLNDPTQGAQWVFGQWAGSGHLDWVTQIAQTGSGPKWNAPSSTQKYGSADQAFATQLVQGYARAAALEPTVVGSSPFPSPFLPASAAQPARGPAPTPTPQTAGVSAVPVWAWGLVAVGGVLALTSGKRGRSRR